jgi:KUP system potassium uptake protein
MYSILQKRPKRADIIGLCTSIFFRTYKTEYRVTEIMKDDLYRVDFILDLEEPKNQLDV